ncbi:MAG: iron ABC transporter permease, partial [Bacteroidetes bacterium]|nr:iron ABC transporter permease [Bacteroidota bacterium]
FLLIAFFILDIVIGSVSVPLKQIFLVFTGSEDVRREWHTIVLGFRLPKALTAVLAGAALSVSGLQMQTIFRNPLAGPYVLGISSGAGLGVAVVVMGFSSLAGIGFLSVMGDWGIAVAAWIGAGLVMLLILAVSVRVRDIMTILILGIMFGAAASSLVSIFQYFSNEALLKSFVVWSLGSLAGVGDRQLYILAAGVLTGIAAAFLSSKMLNALLLGEAYAKSMGMCIRKARLVVFISTSLLAGSVTAFCGPIGFIGIAVPHLARLMLRTSDHNHLITGSLLLGAIVMLVSDILTQLPGHGQVLPVNSVTALLGIPVIVWIIIRNSRFSAFT